MRHIRLYPAKMNRKVFNRVFRKLSDENTPYFVDMDLRKSVNSNDMLIFVDEYCVGLLFCDSIHCTDLPLNCCVQTDYTISYYILDQFRGKGYASKALSIFLSNFPDETFGACCSVHNISSQRILEKNGFVAQSCPLDK